MEDKKPKYVYFKFLGRKQVQVSKEQWEADWKVWHNRVSKKLSSQFGDHKLKNKK